MLSLVGQLQHAASVVKPGRTFLRRMIDLSKVVSQLHFTIRLNNAFRADLEWWHLFISRWNGTSLIQTLSVGARPADVTVFFRCLLIGAVGRARLVTGFKLGGLPCGSL